MFDNPFESIFGPTDGLTINCTVVCGKGAFLLCDVISIRCISKIFCRVVVDFVSTNCSFIKCVGV